MANTTYSREELERQLSESRREFWAADVTINNLEMKLAEMEEQLANSESKCRAHIAEKFAVIVMDGTPAAPPCFSVQNL